MRELLRSHGVTTSLNRAGNYHDDAKAESFKGHPQNQTRSTGKVYATRAEAKSNFFSSIEVFYNRARIHGAPDFCSPMDFEHGLNQNTINLALRLVLQSVSRSDYQDRLSLRGIKRTFGVCYRTVMAWLGRKTESLPAFVDTLRPDQNGEALVGRVAGSLPLVELATMFGHEPTAEGTSPGFERAGTLGA